LKDFSAIRRAVALLVLLAALVLLSWGYWPFENQVNSLLLAPAEMQPAQWATGAQPVAPSAVSAARRLELSYPSMLRVGDMASVYLTLAAATPDNASLGEASTSQPTSEGNWAGEYTVIGEARLDLAGLEHTPPGRAEQALFAGRPLTFIWQIRPEHSGVYEGVVWLHLNYLAQDNRLVARQVLSAQRIRIHAAGLAGITGNMARLLGSSCLVLGVVFGLDGVASWVWRKLQR